MESANGASVRKAGPLTVRSEATAQEWRIELTGELGLENAQTLEEALSEAEQDEDKRLVIDLRGLTHIDSTGVGCIVYAVGRARETGGEIEIVQGPRPVRRIFELTGLLDVLPFRGG